ncbi:MAG: radical SAM protein [Deltaproteobacteria bacterium]|nr:MAG: radical SAM protein [Deltaproteobacteria bacterium]
MTRRGTLASTVYGPVDSRRLGRSLGVDLCPPEVKACPLDCLYCQCGRTAVRIRSAADAPRLAWPDPAAIERDVAEALRAAAAAGRPVDDISLCGNGEPTLHPAFCDIADRVARVRDALAPTASLTVFTSALSEAVLSGAALPGLLRCDRRLMKLDAGTDVRLHRLARPANGAGVADAIAAIAAVPGAEIQALIVSGRAGNDAPAELDAWADAVAQARPVRAHVGTLARAPAEPRAVQPAPRATLEAAAARARARGVPCSVVD